MSGNSHKGGFYLEADYYAQIRLAR